MAERRCMRHGENTMNLSWIGRNRSLELSPRARLVDEDAAEALRRKREALQWRPRNGFLLEDSGSRRDPGEQANRAA
jgi:hypothetical protein